MPRMRAFAVELPRIMSDFAVWMGEDILWRDFTRLRRRPCRTSGEIEGFLRLNEVYLRRAWFSLRD